LFSQVHGPVTFTLTPPAVFDGYSLAEMSDVTNGQHVS